MEVLSNKEIQHLYWRAGFGIKSNELRKLKSFSKEEIVLQLFKKSKKLHPLQIDLDPSIFMQDPKNLTALQRKEFIQIKNQKMNALNSNWVLQMQHTNGFLREKMILFFQNHFAVQLRRPMLMVDFHNTIRKHALGNFGELLMAVSKSPAMIIYLNNRQNKKGSPNENFAREVMELFTLGRDNGYTETDIKEAARAFTGWNFDKTNGFVFRKKHHDFGTKTILGNTGNFKGEDVIAILLKQKQTARYIVQKLYKFLVHETIDTNKVEALTTVFYDSDYSIEVLLKSIFNSNWFYEEKNIGVLIKSPVQLLVGINRQFNVSYENKAPLFVIQQKLNQKLFFPPNVAGWPGGKHWIDSSTLMIRLKLASALLSNGVINMEIKEDTPEESMMMANSKSIKMGFNKNILPYTGWKPYLSKLKLEDKDAIASFLIQPKLSKSASTIISKSKNSTAKEFIVALLSLPEYQLC